MFPQSYKCISISVKGQATKQNPYTAQPALYILIMAVDELVCPFKCEVVLVKSALIFFELRGLIFRINAEC
jgi:hypothetical protein